MKRIICLALLFVVLPARAQGVKTFDAAHWVDTRIGTGSFDPNSLPANVFPGACRPFGMVQLGPDTQAEILTMCSGYYYNDTVVYGFSHTHVNGTGIADLFDILVTPVTGDREEILEKASKNGKEIFSRFSHDSESASPGYYSAFLDDYAVKAELTAATHTGVHRYTFPADRQQYVVVNLDHGITKTRRWFPFKLVDGFFRIEDDRTVSGYRIVTGWSRLRKVYFSIRFNKPLSEHYLISNGVVLGGGTLVAEAIENRNLRGVFEFEASAEPLEMRVGLSTVNSRNALENLTAETEGRPFDSLCGEARAEWNKTLSKVEIEGTDRQKTLFYSALYRTLIQPNILSDVNGEYTRPDFTIGKSDGGYYSLFSLWDTYRAVHPLYTILEPGRDAAFVNSMLDYFDAKGVLPVWGLWGVDNYCMIGNHAIPVIVDACLKKLDGIDPERAYRAVRQTAVTDHAYTSFPSLLDRYGYYPHDANIWEAGSTTLEGSFDDWCVAQLARQYGSPEDYEYFIKRSRSYRNIYDPATGFFRPRLRDGNWAEPFHPQSYYGDGQRKYFTEGNAWHYLFAPVHDLEGLKGLLGGSRMFEKRLDEMFATATDPEVVLEENASGLIGQYVHGNEPCHHYAYLYALAGAPAKTQDMLHRIVGEMYDTTVAGLSGNDDCGQMSAWLVFTMLGFYPVNPADGNYVIGVPMLPYAKLRLDNGSTLEIIARGISPARRYVAGVTYNGRNIGTGKIDHKMIMKGGRIEFSMTGDPLKAKTYF